MKYQYILENGEQKQRLFLCVGSEQNMGTSPIHLHRFSEFFILEKGTLVFEVDNRIYRLKPGNLLAIPAGIPHHCINVPESELSFIWMKSDGFVPETSVIDCPLPIITNLIETVKNLEKDKKLAVKVRALVFFLCYDVFKSDTTNITKASDYDFLIDELLNIDITLEELAKKLNVTPRHAERLLKQHTGKTFNQNRLAFRMLVAKSLINKGELSKKEIAQRVGYTSYQGFLKAYKRYIEEEESFPDTNSPL